MSGVLYGYGRRCSPLRVLTAFCPAKKQSWFMCDTETSLHLLLYIEKREPDVMHKGCPLCKKPNHQMINSNQLAGTVWARSETLISAPYPAQSV